MKPQSPPADVHQEHRPQSAHKPSTPQREPGPPSTQRHQRLQIGACAYLIDTLLSMLDSWLRLCRYRAARQTSGREGSSTDVPSESAAMVTGADTSPTWGYRALWLVAAKHRRACPKRRTQTPRPDSRTIGRLRTWARDRRTASGPRPRRVHAAVDAAPKGPLMLGEVPRSA